jgi:excisionase family DNA binding protein
MRNGKMKENNELLTAKEAADFLKINEKKVYTLAQCGKLPGTKVTGKWIFPKAELETFLRTKAQESVRKSLFESMINKKVVLICGSDDPIMCMAQGLFHKRHPEFTLFASSVGSGEGLKLLRDGFCHIALSHLFDHVSGDFNFPFIDDVFDNPESLVVINLFYRNIGFASKAEPVRSFHDIISKNLRFINRQNYSGIRTLIDHLLKEAKGAPGNIRGYENEAYTHYDATRHIVNGDADVGIATESVVRYANLNFAKIFEERFDMIVHKDTFFDQNIQVFVDFLRSEEFAVLLNTMTGYNSRDTGKVMYAKQT